jgi:hypothetical protein
MPVSCFRYMLVHGNANFVVGNYHGILVPLKFGIHHLAWIELHDDLRHCHLELDQSKAINNACQSFLYSAAQARSFSKKGDLPMQDRLPEEKTSKSCCISRLSSVIHRYA